MGLTRADIVHATIIGLTLVASAIAIPVMASGHQQSVVGSHVRVSLLKPLVQ
ncbi:MAG: hypothetical protein WBG73_10730 [Coleofasciculaceae cyanobacterium]